MARIPTATLFVERDGIPYVVVNWKERSTDAVKAQLLRLAPRHAERYRAIKAKGRSQKSMYYYVFGRVRKARPVLPAATPAKPQTRRLARPGPTPEATAIVPLRLLTAAQLHELIRLHVGHDLPGLATLPVDQLRVLYLALVRDGGAPAA